MAVLTLEKQCKLKVLTKPAKSVFAQHNNRLELMYFRRMKDGQELDDNYWSNLYLTEETRWDIGHPSSPLSEYISSLRDKNIAILIPGAGNAYEANDLLTKGFSAVSVIDISSILVQRLTEKFAGKSIEIFHGNFFDHSGEYELILEQTFFCALNPSLRKAYSQKMYELLKPGGRLAGVLFNRAFEDGPPFGGSKNEYIDLFSPLFEIKKMEPCYNSILPRQGTELFFILQKLS